MNLLIAGFDGLGWELINKYYNCFPFLSYMVMNSGAWFKAVDSPVPNTPAGWSSIYTGVMPEDHGIKDWTDNWYDDKQTNKLSTYIDLKVEPFWKFLVNEHRVGLFNLPCTYPVVPEDRCTFHVAGFPTANWLGSEHYIGDQYPWCYPDSLVYDHEIIPEDYKVDVTDVQLDHGGLQLSYKNFEEVYYPSLLKIENQHERVFNDLVNLFNIDIGFIVFQHIDRLMHWLPCVPDAEYRNSLVRSCLTRVDNIMEELWRTHTPENMIICSDHGWMPLQKHTKDSVCIYFNKDGKHPPNIRPEAVKSVNDVTKLILDVCGVNWRNGIGRPRKLDRDKYITTFSESQDAIRKKLEGLGYV